MPTEFKINNKVYRAKHISAEVRAKIMERAAPAIAACLDAKEGKEIATFAALASLPPETFEPLRDALMSHLTRRCALGWRAVWNKAKHGFVFDDIDLETQVQLFVRVLAIEIQKSFEV